MNTHSRVRVHHMSASIPYNEVELDQDNPPIHEDVGVQQESSEWTSLTLDPCDIYNFDAELDDYDAVGISNTGGPIYGQNINEDDTFDLYQLDRIEAEADMKARSVMSDVALCIIDSPSNQIERVSSNTSLCATGC